MRDLVEAALERQKDQEHNEEADANEFGEPLSLLLGYGDLGVEITRQGWDSRYSHPKYSKTITDSVQEVADLPTAATEADYVILTGSTECCRLGETVGEILPEKTTSIALPIPVDSENIQEINAVDATIPCKRKFTQELATDLLTILTAQIQVSPPPQLYQELQTAGLIQGFRGQRKYVSSKNTEYDLAEKLVTNTLENPFYDGCNHAETCISFLHAGNDLTLKETEAIREEITSRIGSEVEPELFTADTTNSMEDMYRLVLLCI